jgi:hypothetical protein
MKYLMKILENIEEMRLAVTIPVVLKAIKPERSENDYTISCGQDLKAIGTPKGYLGERQQEAAAMTHRVAGRRLAAGRCGRTGHAYR